MIFYMPGISYINPHFRAPRPLKPLKSNSRCQNLLGGISYSSFRARQSPKSIKNRQKSTYVDLYFLYYAILGPLKARFDQLDR